MKKILIIALAMVFAIQANAQLKFGVKGGLDFVNFNLSGSIGSQLKQDKATAWNFGLVAQVGLGSSVCLQPELLYVQEKITFKHKEMGTLKDSDLSYIQVPVNLLYKITMPGFEPFVSVGPYFGYSVKTGGGFKEMKDNIKKVDWGLGVGVGVDIWKVQVTARYNWALQNISDAKNIEMKNNKFNLSVAFFIL